MKKLKDFTYNISDILVALLILLISTGVILWRMEKIIAYPDKILVDNDVYYDEIEEPEVEDTSEKEESEVYTIYGSDGKLMNDISLTLTTGDSAKSIIGKLVDAGLLESYSEYEAICKENGWEEGKVKSGKITFKAGLTKVQVVDQVNIG